VAIEHLVITDPNIHEPKGASTAASNQVYVTDGSGSGAWVGVDDLTIFPVANTFWDDLRFPATSINPTGGASDADVDTNDGTFLFAATGTEVIAVVAQMPHAWKSGTSIYPHVHWAKTTSAAGDVVWQLEYRLYPVGGTGTTTFSVHGSAAAPVSDTPDNDTAEEHLITSFGEFTMATGELSDIIIFRISRLGSDGSDTYGADARLLEFDFHYEIDSLGSSEQFTE